FGMGGDRDSAGAAGFAQGFAREGDDARRIEREGFAEEAFGEQAREVHHLVELALEGGAFTGREDELAGGDGARSFGARARGELGRERGSAGFGALHDG